MHRISQYPATAILRHVVELSRIGFEDREKPTVIVEDMVSTDWASITFAGLCHVIALRLEGDRDVVAAAVARLADDLGDADLPIAGHFVAEIAVTAVEAAQPIAAVSTMHCAQRLRIEALTVRD